MVAARSAVIRPWWSSATERSPSRVGRGHGQRRNGGGIRNEGGDAHASSCSPNAARRSSFRWNAVAGGWSASTSEQRGRGEGPFPFDQSVGPSTTSDESRK